MNQLIADLHATRAMLASRGWCQNRIVNPEGNVCLNGAVVAALLGVRALNMADQPQCQVFQYPRVRAVVAALAQHLPHRDPGCWHGLGCTPEGEVAEFNDCRAVSVQDCNDVIDKALAELGGL